MYEADIRIGTLVKVKGDTLGYLRQIVPHGFESFSLVFGAAIAPDFDMAAFAAQVGETLAGSGAIISSVCTYGNPLRTDETGAEARRAYEVLIDSAHLFGCDVVGGFTGRIPDLPVEQSLARYAEVFAPLAARAADRGVRIAFENCAKGGNWQRGEWNIAHNPAAWEMMFDVLPADNLGLQWEPCHQMIKLIDPMPQLRKWVSKIFHVHGKDATILWDVVREHGIHGPKPFAFHRTPGFGDCNWTDVISTLRQGGFTGSIDIEGWHDPVYKDELEMMGQVYGLNYLKQCRGTFVPNPVLATV